MKQKQFDQKAKTLNHAKPARMDLPLNLGYQKEITAAEVRGKDYMSKIAEARAAQAARDGMRVFPPARRPKGA